MLTPAKIQRSSLPFHFRLVSFRENILMFNSIIVARQIARRVRNNGEAIILSFV